MRRRDFLLGLPGCALLACGGRDDVAHSLKTNHVPFLPGMRTDLTEENAPPGTLLTATNVRYSKSGGIFVRPGTGAAISSATQGTTDEIEDSGGLSFAGSSGGAAVLGTVAGKVFARDESGPLMNYCGKFSSCLPLRKRRGLLSEVNGSVNQAKYAVAANDSGYVLVASCDDTNVNIFIESPEGVRLYESGTHATGSKVSAISTGEEFIVVYQSGTLLTVDEFAISSGQITYSSGSVGALNSASQYWDITPANSGWIIIYQSGAALLTIAEFVGTSFDSTFATIAVTGNCPCSVYYHADSNRVWASWWNSPGVGNQLRTRAWLGGVAQCAETTLETSSGLAPAIFGPVGAGQSGSIFFTYNRDVNSPGLCYGYLLLPANPANVATEVSSRAFWVKAISKPDAMQRSWVMTCSVATGYSGSEVVTQRCLLLRWTQPTGSDFNGTSTIELSMPSYADDFISATRPYLDMFATACEVDGVYTFALPREVRSGYSGYLWGLDVVQYESIEAHPQRSTVQMNDALFVAGQPAQVFGRARSIAAVSGPTVNPDQGSVEIGFPIGPQIINVGQTAAGSLPAGTYSYTAVIEWIGTDGTRHQSPPSLPVRVTVTGAADDGITLRISCPNYGQRWDASSDVYPVIHIYRTEVGGTVHYRATPGNNAPLAFDNTTGYVSWQDTVSDSQIVLVGDALYVDQALCDYNLAPSCRFMWKDEARVYFGGLWEGNQVHASLDPAAQQPLQSSDFEGANGPVFRALVGETVTGGEYQDGINYVFCERAIYAFSGDGPDRQGNGDFSRARVLTRETGCKDYRSVKATSRGVFFQSQRGIELIPRGGGLPQFVGAGIQDLTAVYSTCLGAAIHSDSKSRTVRFLLQRPSNSTTLIAEFDLDINAWSYSTYYAAMQIIGEWPSGTFLGFADQSESVCGLLEEHNTTEERDNSSAVTSIIGTHVLRPWGPAGYGRLNSVTLLMSKASGTDILDMYVTLDGEDVNRPAGPWTLSATSESLYRELTVCKEGTGFSVNVQLTRAEDLRVPVLHAFTFEADPHQGARRLPASEQ